ncbi:hypothetical protein A2456_00085 [Candidatus Nomurabacteria bacterium RIFOXYC2_FULL_36_19]|uniref:Uncharacterized protein n=3 Tax=Candidatus Nomuraibacteriota TaxID=1752729 RepID=A0A1F6YTN4_9BACT|nr:MAG: hypothetical protein UR91_C0001G0006 [Candidatus Nomurabacteria bacterium GW2011_GWC2_35_8]OGJ05705.1 MAG: hypothetical protein A2238_00580 [Candidatus Nomurabacteria bacterium RIFOXYA2_FULL_35_9]OGJ06121.1 MAG: hypothetical protein A2192_01755 [Candidatus Nomurabacteria bacterium RIFOXYA1_FULL_35_17]OGJ09708.1 MAG: hypothetical protein A2456_00085 [Candidatus Nomurabacteria bacterium RIFOXYC2_FULL_36_19]OGJ14572.1 MAG: hypothetical protein A2554_02115 [Candidatus Nomurabacteria bacteri
MDKKEEGLIEKVNKLSLPATILIGCVILGGFYYMSQVSKQNSIEKQQRLEIQTKKEAQEAEATKEASAKLGKMFCVSEAEELAQSQYKKTCTYDCKEGYYYTANYENYYKVCLQRKGLD